jgi:hypothetical protein
VAQAKANQVWRRSATAARVRLSEESFVEWCILMGNDFTGTDAFNRNKFDALTDMSPLLDGMNDESEDEEEEYMIMEEEMGLNVAAQIRYRNSHSPEYLMKLYETIRVNHDNCRLSSRSEELQLAIDFSR